MGIDQLYDARDYDSFGCLFGVTNFAGFEPVAAERGLPVWSVMETLAGLHGPDNVRLVAWFCH